ncbi:hypothetical protein FAES_3139 [Fibrella aestuarina BUZ 2]|uniref:Uncharacterized protein n=1 Tax=Fibrella aestuarina BUZ 2 TaxID=1166018 RepID=I0KAJ5_9BACT|nr:hypothetical protein FAES_3139 [Fibrella aestuarina BUZ 2]
MPVWQLIGAAGPTLPNRSGNVGRSVGYRLAKLVRSFFVTGCL